MVLHKKKNFLKYYVLQSPFLGSKVKGERGNKILIHQMVQEKQTITRTSISYPTVPSILPQKCCFIKRGVQQCPVGCQGSNVNCKQIRNHIMVQASVTDFNKPIVRP